MAGEFSKILARQKYLEQHEGCPNLRELFKRQILRLWADWVEELRRLRLH